MKNQGVWVRKIIHIDMDAFFAAVEQRDHPEYRGKPVIVGGDPRGRGVVSTASYEARKFGIRSAMPAAQALKLCPQAIFLRPRFERYQEVSETLMKILRQHTGRVEPVSLDEAYLDVTEHRLGLEDPVMIAALIKQSLRTVTRLTASAGVAPNCFLAKVASDLKKPDGLTVVLPDQARAFLRDLPVRKIPGVGPVTEKELHRLKLWTCSDLEEAGTDFLRRHFGRFGQTLFDRSQGKDDRSVEPDGQPKQFSTEETFEKDTRDFLFLKRKLEAFSRELFEGLLRDGRVGRTVVLKVKYFDFELVTRSLTLPYDPAGPEDLSETAVRLLQERTRIREKPVRLLGLGVAGLRPRSPGSPSAVQPELFPLHSHL